MNRGQFRPWGLLQKLFERSSPRTWKFLGCIAVEDRCLGAWSIANRYSVVDFSLMVRVKNAKSQSEALTEQMTTVQEQRFIAQGGDVASIHNIGLFGRQSNLEELVNSFLSNSGENLIVDISCLPKRIFFLVLRLILRSSHAKNVLVTYTIPEQYDRSTPLAGDPESWAHLPGFMPPYLTTSPPLLLVGIGYEPLGLPQILESGGFDAENIKLLFPFPSSLGGLERNWQVALDIARRRSPASLNIIRVDAKDVSQTFDTIMALADRGRIPVVLAPFGPKTVSLAMCLYAIAQAEAGANVPVYYTQPQTYNPHYSNGIARVRGVEECYGYFVRSNGTNLFPA